LRNRAELVEKLEHMHYNQTITFPAARSNFQVHIHRRIRNGELMWLVEVKDKEVYRSTRVQQTVDYLLQLRPLTDYVNPMNRFVEEVQFDGIYNC
jgi:hypothetical protein